jgi:CMP-N-acetylneuraminic acid synthetase
MMQFLALIPARGGSKGIPGKNIRDLVGKPLIAWTIETALNCKVCSKVVVSTDNQKTMAIARDWGAEVPFIRPEHLSRDDATSISVVHHAIEYFLTIGFNKSDYILLLQPTSPLRTADDIKNAIDIAQSKQADAVVSVTSAPSHPYLTKKITPLGILNGFLDGKFDNIRRQDLPPAYALNGAIYLNKISSLLEENTFLPENKTYAYVMPPERSIDIDTSWDFYLAELILKDQKILPA